MFNLIFAVIWLLVFALVLLLRWQSAEPHPLTESRTLWLAGGLCAYNLVRAGFWFAALRRRQRTAPAETWLETTHRQPKVTDPQFDFSREEPPPEK